MKQTSAAILAAIAFIAVAVSPTGVFAFSVPKRILVRTPTSALFGEQTCCGMVGKRRRGYSTRDSWIALRGGSGASDSIEQPRQPAAIETKPTPFLGLSEAYYLVWSPGFLRKLAVATSILAVVRRFGWDHRLLDAFAGNLGWLPPGLVSNIVLPLLSSSCCAIQMAVNAVSVAVMGAGAGCLGFNTVLGPVRPYLMAVMIAYHTGFPVPPLYPTVSRFAVALMPEVVFGWNELLRSRWRRKNEASGGGDGSAANAESSTGANGAIKATLTVEVPTMGCVACINKIESSLRSCAPENIASASSWLNPKDEPTAAAKAAGKKGGRTQIEIQASSRDELNDLTKRLVGAIEDAGFKGNVVETLDVQP